MTRKPNSEPVPRKFASEEEEANWWDEHSEEHDEQMLQAIRAGETTTLEAVLKRARERSQKASAGSIRIDLGDLARAQDIAARKGLEYEAYLQALVHEALVREEERLAG
jgi:predicted DNA binding CopG/RHH family protein